MDSLNYGHVRFCIYARKSQNREDMQVQSLESQKRELQAYAQKMGLHVVAIYEDSASAHKPNNRPEFDKMLKAIESGEIQGILTWKADRIARNMIEAGVIIHKLQTEQFAMIKTPFSQYLSTDNMLMLIIEMGMANQYSLDLSKNIKRGNKTKIENGGFCNNAPIGYLNCKETRSIIKDPKRFKKVQEVFKLFLTGKYSVKDLEKLCETKLFLKSIKGESYLKKASLYRVLNNPFYYGRVKNGEHTGWGAHTAMISEKEFYEIQDILQQTNRKAVTSQDFAYTGFIKCGECTSGITAVKKVKYRCPSCNAMQTARHPRKCKCGYHICEKDIAKGKYYTYYMCTKAKGKCSQKPLNADKLDTQFVAFVGDLMVNNDFVKWSESFLEYLEKHWQELFDTGEVETQQELKKLKSQRMELLDLKLQKSISTELFHEKNTVLENRIRTLEQLQVCKSEQIQKVKEELTFLKNLQNEFKTAGVKHKKSVIKKLVLNPALLDKVLHTQAKEKYLAILSMRKHKKLTSELGKNQSIKGLTTLQRNCLSDWWSVVNDIWNFDQ